MTQDPLIHTWKSMRNRCCNPTARDYPRYGGRGVTICDRWRRSFEAFAEDVGPRPRDRHSLDRIDNDGNYEPGNVRWATSTEQANNRSDNRILVFDGEAKTVTEWARVRGWCARTLRNRLRRGWSTERALTVPLPDRRSGPCPACADSPRAPGDSYCRPCRAAKSRARRAAKTLAKDRGSASSAGGSIHGRNIPKHPAGGRGGQR